MNWAYNKGWQDAAADSWILDEAHLPVAKCFVKFELGLFVPFLARLL